MTNIQQFLEEEYKQVVTDFSKETLYKTIEDHDTRLINFILSEVERNVREKYHCDTEEEQKLISTIITNLMVK